MNKLSPTQMLVENFIEKNQIHLVSKAALNRSLFVDNAKIGKEIRNAKLKITNSVGKFLMQRKKIKKYIKEKTVDNITTLSFDVFVFSASELKDFVKTISQDLRVLH